MKVTDQMVDRVIKAMHDHGWLGWGPDEEGPGPGQARAEVRLFLKLALAEAGEDDLCRLSERVAFLKDAWGSGVLERQFYEDSPKPWDPQKPERPT